MSAILQKESLNKNLGFLLEIRKRLLIIGTLFLLASLLGFIYYQKIIFIILTFFKLDGVNIVFTTPFQFFTIALNCGIIVGVVVVIPVIIHQLITFLRPALNAREYRILVSILPLAIILLVGGFTYGVFVMKYLLQIFYKTSVSLNIGNMIDVENFFSKVLMTGLLMGLAFLFPIVMTILMQLKLIKHQTFEAQRSTAYIICCLFVIFLPPPDLFSDIVLIAPLIILFELTLILNRIFLKTHLL